MNVQRSDLIDPALVAEVDLARAAAQEEAGDERVGDYVEYQIEDSAAVTHLFEADKPGYRGWRWAVTITSAGPATDVTVSEVVLLPGPTALVAPEWIPWQQRVQAGDLGVGDLLPTSPDDPRLVPAYVASDDPAVEEVAAEAGLGRVRVMSRSARLDAADRWLAGDFGPRSDMARSAPAQCGTCGFYLPLAGSLRVAFGTCGNEFSPADGHVVHVEYGCGAHSEAEVEQVSPVLVADLIYDDAQLDVEPLTVVDEVPSEDAVLSHAGGSAVESAADSGVTAAVAPEAVVSSESESAETAAEPADDEDAASVSGVATSAVPGVVVSDSEAPAVESAGPAADEDVASVSGVTTSAVPEAVVAEEEVPAVEAGSGESGTAGESAGSVVGAASVSDVTTSAVPGVVGSDSEAPAVESAGPAADEDAASVSDVTTSAAPEVAVSDDEVGSDEGTAVDSAPSPVDEASVSAVTTPDESTAPEAAGSGEEASAVDPGESSGEPGLAAEEESDEAGSGEFADEVPVAAAPVVEAAAPAAIEPVVTGETSPSDESASRE